jgi:hypothetical protein
MVVATDGESPAPDGTIELEDGRVIEVAAGLISTVTESPLGPDATTAQKMKAMMAAMDPAGNSSDPVVVMLRALMESTFGWEIREQQAKATREAAIAAYRTQMSAIETENKTLKTELQALKDSRKAENESVLQAFEVTMAAISEVAKAPIGGEANPNKVFPKSNNAGGPLGRKAAEMAG